LSHHEHLSEIDVDYLRRKDIRARDADDHEVHRWSVWRCLTGEFELNGATYVVDEGEIFEVSADYLERLNAYLSQLPLHPTAAWTQPTRILQEDSYNSALARCSRTSSAYGRETCPRRLADDAHRSVRRANRESPADPRQAPSHLTRAEPPVRARVRVSQLAPSRL